MCSGQLSWLDKLIKVRIKLFDVIQCGKCAGNLWCNPWIHYVVDALIVKLLVTLGPLGNK